MIQMQEEVRQYRREVRDKFRSSLQQVKAVYGERVSELQQHKIKQGKRIKQLQKTLYTKEAELEKANWQNCNLESKVSGLSARLLTLQRANECAADKAKAEMQRCEHFTQQLLQRLNEKNDQIKLLQQQVKEKIDEIRRLNLQEVMSLDMSSVSRNEVNSFSISISEIFKNSPQHILQFLGSVEGEKPHVEKQEGDMTCMFVSRDHVSLQKFEGVNRNFLKRKIKEHEKQFRFVLIYKPDKA